MSIFITLVVFVFIFSLLVLVHEFGHFWTARRAGIKVLEFGIGLPPRLFGRKKGETIYSINAIPFGGFVRLYGEDPRDKGALKSPKSFINKSVFQRMMVVCAGVFMNFLLAFVLLVIGFVYGIQPLIMNGDDLLQNIDNGVVRVQSGMIVKEAAPKSQAFLMGFRPGDQVLGFDSENIVTVEEFLEYIQTQKLSELSVLREGQRAVLKVPQEFVVDDFGLSFYEFFELPRVRIYEFAPYSLASKVGFQKGDVILTANDRQVYFSDDLMDILSFSSQGDFTVFRGQKEVSLHYDRSVAGPVVLSHILPDSIAEKSGLQKGDIIVSINNEPVESFEDVRSKTQIGQKLSFSILRNRRTYTFNIVPDENGLIGVILALLTSDPFLGMRVYNDVQLTSVLEVAPVRYSLLEAPGHAFSEMKRLSVLTVQMFVGVLRTLIGEGQVPSDVAGPVGIAQLTYVFVKEGFLSVLRFTALLSLSLGVINILPIPALDGGRLLFLIVEVLRRKRANAKWEALIHSFGYALLLLLIFFVTYNDIVRLVTGAMNIDV